MEPLASLSTAVCGDLNTPVRFNLLRNQTKHQNPYQTRDTNLQHPKRYGVTQHRPTRTTLAQKPTTYIPMKVA